VSEVIVWLQLLNSSMMMKKTKERKKRCLISLSILISFFINDSSMYALPRFMGVIVLAPIQLPDPLFRVKPFESKRKVHVFQFISFYSRK